MGALAAGSSAALGTGAFNSASVERDMTLEVAGDADAYLALESLNDNYARERDGRLELDFSDRWAYGDGVSDQAEYWFDKTFRITNNGTDTVEVMVDDNGLNHSERVIFYTGASTDEFDPGVDSFAGIVPVEGFSAIIGESFNTSGEGLRVGDDDGTAILLDDDTYWAELGPGESVDIGIYVNTRDDLQDAYDDADIGGDVDVDPIGEDDTIEGELLVVAGELSG